MRNSKINVKLLLPYAVVFPLLLAGLVISLGNLMNIEKQIELFYNGSYMVKNAIDTMDTNFESMQKVVFRSISIPSQDINQEAVTNIKNSTILIEKQIAVIQQNFPEDTSRISELETNLSKLEPMWDHVFHLTAQNKNAEALEYMEHNNIPAIKKVQEELALLTQSVEGKESEILLSLKEIQRKTTILLISIGVVSVMFGIEFGIYIMRLQKLGEIKKE